MGKETDNTRSAKPRVSIQQVSKSKSSNERTDFSFNHSQSVASYDNLTIIYRL